MKLIVVVLLYLVHTSCGSLLEENIGDDDILLQRTRKDSSKIPDQKNKCLVSGFAVVQDLDLGKLNGDWYEAFRTATSEHFRTGVWRLQATTQKNVSEFTFTAKLRNDKCMAPIKGKLSLSDSRTSTIKLNYNGLKSRIEEEFEVVHTDHQNLLVLYGCQHLSASGQCSPDAFVLIILTKIRLMSPAVLDHLKLWADKVCIGLHSLIQQDSVRSCNLDELDHEIWKDSYAASQFACKKTAPCTLACPPCCEEGEDGCIRCKCRERPQEVTSGETNSNHDKDTIEVEQNQDEGCVLNVRDCAGSHCLLAEKRPGCNVCNCKALYRAPSVLVSRVKTITDVRECPTSCRTRNEEAKLICDCSNKETCSPIPPNVPLSCQEQLERYYFDDRTGTCHAFYGSCLEGPNNFNSLKECIEVCAEVCELPLDPGRCKTGSSTYIDRYYFNRIRGVCDSFIYGGCGGNANNFESLQMCKHQCPEWMEETNANRRPDKCYQSPVKGNCGETQIKYFFLNITKTCTSFFYSGCGQGPNHFDTLEECEDICSGNTQLAPKQCPDIGDCPCSPTMKEDECLECPCKPDTGGGGSGDNGVNLLPGPVLLLTSYIWLRWQL